MASDDLDRGEHPGGNALAHRHRLHRQVAIQRALPRLARALKQAPCVTGPGAELIPERWPWPDGSADEAAYSRTVEGWHCSHADWQSACRQVRQLGLAKTVAGHLVLDAGGPAFLVDFDHYPTLVGELLHFAEDNGRAGFAWVATSGECGVILARQHQAGAQPRRGHYTIVHWGARDSRTGTRIRLSGGIDPRHPPQGRLYGG